MPDQIVPKNLILLRTESRPSAYTGISWWLVLSYKEKEYEELLPYDWLSRPEPEQEDLVDDAREKVMAKLKPIILAEDGEHLSLVADENS